MSTTHKISHSKTDKIFLSRIQTEIFLPLLTDRYNPGLQMVSFALTINTFPSTLAKNFSIQWRIWLRVYGPFGAINYDQFDIITELILCGLGKSTRCCAVSRVIEDYIATINGIYPQ